MESGSSGSWSDYSSSTSIKKATSEAIESSGAAAGVSGGGGASDRCAIGILNLDLEDVARSEFNKNKGQLPNPGTPIQVKKEVQDGRLAVILNSGEVIGLLPSKMNYLRLCMEEGHSYGGEVAVSRSKPLPSISITLQNS